MKSTFANNSPQTQVAIGVEVFMHKL
jgi:hypothetical protein